MIKNYILAVLTGATLLAACEPSLKVTSDYDKKANFTSYKTFSIALDSVHQPVSPLNRSRIINAVRAELMKKGFTENVNTPDLYVDIATIMKDKTSVSSSTNYYGYGAYYRPYGWGGGMGGSSYTTYDVQNYKDGSLIIDIADASTKNLIWEGIGNREIDGPVSNPDQVIADAVAKIMAGFPPGAKSK